MVKFAERIISCATGGCFDSLTFMIILWKYRASPRIIREIEKLN